MNNDSLKILIETAIALEKSLQNMTADLGKLQERLRTYQVKVLAGLDKERSAAQIRSDLKQVNRGKQRIRIIGEVDKTELRKSLDETLKKLKGAEIKIAGILDSAQLKGQLEQIPSIAPKAAIDVDGLEQVDDLRQKMDKAGGSAENMASRLYLARTALQALRRAAHEAIDMVQELDAAATNLAIVTNSNTSEMYGLLEQYNDLAGQLGATTVQVADAAASWLRQGKSAAETASLIEQSLILSKIAMMSSEDATKRLTSALNGYRLAAQDASTVVDKLAALDSRAAVTADDLAVAMSQTASSANIGGVSMDRLLGYLATVQEVTQRSAETIGQAFKTIFARIGNIKLGNFLSDDGEDLSDVETVLKNYGVALRNTEGDFRNFGNILDDVHEKWEQFGAIDKRAVAQAFAGTRQQENFLTLMENYGKALEYAEVAANSAGVALGKFGAYEDSIEAKTARFTASLEGLTLDTVDAEFVGDLIDAGTSIVELVEKTGLLKAALVGLGAGAVLKGISAMSSGFAAAKQNITSLGEAMQIMRAIQDTSTLSGETIARLGTLTKNLTDQQLRLVLSSQQLTNAQMTQIFTAGGLSEAEAAAKMQTLGLTAAEGSATAATVGLSGAALGLGTALKAAFASNPIGMIMLAVGVVYELTQCIEAYRQNIEDALQESVSKHKELADEVTDLESELRSVGDRMKELSELDAPTVSDQEELDRLRETNDELERELRIKTALKEQAAVDAENAAKKWLGIQTFGYEYDSFGGPSAKLDWNVAADRLMSSVENYRAQLEAAKNAMDAASGDVTSSAFKSAQNQADVAQKNIDSTLKELSDIYTTIKENVIDAIGDQADTEWGKQILATWDVFEKAYDKLLSDGNEIEAPEVDVEGAADSVDAYTANLSKLSDVISGMKSAYDALEAAQSDMDSGAGLSIDTIEKLAKENENYLDYLYEENGAIKLNTEAWKENANAKMQNEMAEIQKEIDSLNERNKVLLESIAYFEQMKDTDGNVGMWDQEIAKARAEIEKNTEAVGENQEKMALYEAIFKQIQSDSDEAFSSITDHLTFITGQYDLLTKAQEESAKSGVMSASTLSSIADKFPEMEDSVNLYIAGLKTSQELLDELSVAYGTDFENYQRSIVAKLESSEEFYNALTDDQKKLIDELGKSYGVDLENFKSIESKKLEFQAKIIEQLASNYSRYSGASLEQMKAEYDIRKSIGGPTAELYDSEMAALGDAIRKIESYNKALSEIAAGSGLVKAYDPKKIKSSTSGGSASKEVEEYTAAIDQYREAAERLRKVQEDRSAVERKINGTDDLKEQIVLQKQLIDVYQQEQSALHNLNDQRDATITAGAQSLRELGFAVQYNADTNELWISNMEHLNELTAKSRGEYGSLQEATNALRKDTEELIGTLTDLNEENRSGSSSWLDLKDSIRNAKLAIVNDLKDIVSEASGAVDTIQDAYSTLKSAADEYADNGGFLTLDTIQAIVDLEPQYMQYLIAENDLLVINEENIQKVLAAKTEQLALDNAMSYVERLRLALEKDSIEDLNELLYATTAATDATWGLVYANLALLDLDADQYQAALHNINSIRSLADAAVDGIGRTAGEAAKAAEEAAEAAKKELEDLRDELEGMQDAGDDIIQYVMDMLKHRIQKQIDLLEDMKDKYSEIIDLKKESLRASKDEEDYQKKIKSKLKDMAKLQEKIDALGLDDSRSAQAERAKLLEELAELQDDLNDTQAEKSIEATEDALDKMEEAYHQEKDTEIKILEDSISSTQKLYDMAIGYIRDHWDTLYSELISWNTEYGSVLNSEITEAWGNCQAAAQRYGDFVTAMMGGIKNEIASINAQIESLDLNRSSSSRGSYGSGASNSGNTVVGEKKDYSSDYTSGYAAKISDLVEQMRENSRKWHSASSNERSRLHEDSADKANQIARLGVMTTYNPQTGEWIISSDKWNPSFVGRKLFDVYHSGGVVGGGTIKDNEQLALLKKGEWVLNSPMVESVKRITTMMKAFTDNPPFLTQPILPDFSHLNRSTINNITNNSRPVEVHFGDTIIQGEPSSKTVREHIKVTEDMVNQFARLVGAKW